MNATVNKLLLAGDKFMSEMHLRQPEFTYSVCGPFTKKKKKSKYLKKLETQDIFIKMNYNPVHNILALFNNLAQVLIATSKTIRDI